MLQTYLHLVTLINNMSKLRNEILQLGLMNNNAAISIISLDENYSGFLYKDYKSQGVFIKYDGDLDVLIKFANLTLKTMVYKESNVLYLSTSLNNDVKMFSFVAENFLLPENRIILQTNPHDWCDEWSKLLGNINKKRLVSDLVAELYVYDYLLENYDKVNWGASNKTTNDFQLQDFSVEVKSTTMKTSSMISINSKFQLQGDKPVYLYFVRLEKIPFKNSIESLVSNLISKGVSEEYLEMHLEQLDYPKGVKERHESYEILEVRAYRVDDENFPLISIENINKLAGSNNIVNFKLEFDLTGINYHKIK